MSGRYANALFECALEAGYLDEVWQDLGRFQTALSESADLQRLVRSPVFSKDQQKNAILALFQKINFSEIVTNFFMLVIEKRRLYAINAMIDDYKSLLSQYLGEVHADVTSAVELSDAQLGELKTSLKNYVNQDVAVNTQVDPALLGGLVVKIGSIMMDTSLRTKLNRLKMTMKEVG